MVIMANIEIKHLLRNNRLPESDASLICFLLYSPVGFIIFILRAILLLGLFILGQVLPDTPVTQKFINKIACLALGISVSIENPRKKDNVDVYISNSVSIFDQLAICSATGSVSPSARTALEKVLCLSTYCFGNVTNTDNFKNSINQFMAERKTPLYFAPEGKPTNGKGLLKFKTYAFEISSKIQPICITIERPLLDISVTTLGSSYFSDLFYFMFVPLTIYKLKFLTSLEQKCLSNSDFADIVRKDIATTLKIEMTEFTSNDLVEWEKRKLAEEQQRAQNRNINRPIVPEIQRMSYQVKEVLPHVPFNVIYNDLLSASVYFHENIKFFIKHEWYFNRFKMAQDQLTSGSIFETSPWYNAIKIYNHLPQDFKDMQSSKGLLRSERKYLCNLEPYSFSSTRSVDSTITNILEGRLHFTPEQTTASTQQSSHSSTTNSTMSGPSSSRGKLFSVMGASTFSKSATERSKSYQERKEQLIASARKRYIEKHNLDIPL